ncbi:hypothetical protein, partial [Streptomyces sp. NPDC057909]|uniref:hypothetical protein n=1 Tax=Streptomyces sp. NPDC057909 TaxID=3346277 RepID=UPI0036EF4B46
MTIRSARQIRGDGAGGGPVDLGLADRSAEGLQGERGHSQIDFDRGLGQALGEVAIAGAARYRRFVRDLSVLLQLTTVLRSMERGQRGPM